MPPAGEENLKLLSVSMLFLKSIEGRNSNSKGKSWWRVGSRFVRLYFLKVCYPIIYLDLKTLRHSLPVSGKKSCVDWLALGNSVGGFLWYSTRDYINRSLSRPWIAFFRENSKKDLWSQIIRIRQHRKNERSEKGSFTMITHANISAVDKNIRHHPVTCINCTKRITKGAFC